MSWETIYDSAWQHPGVAWIGGLVATSLLGLRYVADRRMLGRSQQVASHAGGLSTASASWSLLLLLQCLICVDALFTGALSPFDASGVPARVLSILFVVLGDARYFYLWLRLRATTATAPLVAVRALALGGALSLLAYGLHRAAPAHLATGRHLFLTYELLLCGVVTLQFVRALRARFADQASGHGVVTSRALVRLSLFELAQYVLWAAADLWILYVGDAADIGFALRLLPNALYYVAFVPFVALFCRVSPDATARADVAPIPLQAVAS